MRTFLVSDFAETSFIIISKIKNFTILAILQNNLSVGIYIPTATFKIGGILAKKIFRKFLETLLVISL